jgi:hypothetical protein
VSPSTANKPERRPTLSRETFALARSPGALKYQVSSDTTVAGVALEVDEVAVGEPQAASASAARRAVEREAVLTYWRPATGLPVNNVAE